MRALLIIAIIVVLYAPIIIHSIRKWREFREVK